MKTFDQISGPGKRCENTADQARMVSNLIESVKARKATSGSCGKVRDFVETERLSLHIEVDAIGFAFDLGLFLVAKRFGGDDEEPVGADLAAGQ